MDPFAVYLRRTGRDGEGAKAMAMGRNHVPGASLASARAAVVAVARSQTAPSCSGFIIRRISRVGILSISAAWAAVASRSEAQLPKARTISGKIQSLDTIPFRLPGQDQAPGTRTRGSNLSRSRAI